MAKAAVVILAGTEARADLGRVVNGLETAAEFAETDGDEVRLIFDGGGTQWVPELEAEDHDYHALYAAVREYVEVCDYCVSAYGVDEAVDEVEVERVGEFDGHPSLRSLVADGYEVITF